MCIFQSLQSRGRNKNSINHDSKLEIEHAENEGEDIISVKGTADHKLEAFALTAINFCCHRYCFLDGYVGSILTSLSYKIWRVKKFRTTCMQVAGYVSWTCGLNWERRIEWKSHLLNRQPPRISDCYSFFFFPFYSEFVHNCFQANSDDKINAESL